jgi:hypothetical protein
VLDLQRPQLQIKWSEVVSASGVLEVVEDIFKNVPFLKIVWFYFCLFLKNSSLKNLYSQPNSPTDSVIRLDQQQVP